METSTISDSISSVVNLNGFHFAGNGDLPYLSCQELKTLTKR